MNPDILDDLTPEVSQKRTALLSTLCILTWLGSSLLVFYQAYQYYLLRDIVVRMSMDSSDSIFQYYFITSIISAALALMRIVAAVQMWQLRKIGFYLYLTSCCADTLVSLYYNISMIGIVNIFSISTLVVLIPAAFSALFIGLYYISFKQMK